MAYSAPTATVSSHGVGGRLTSSSLFSRLTDSNFSFNFNFSSKRCADFRKRCFYVRSDAKPKLKDQVIVEQGSIDSSNSDVVAVASRITYHADYTSSFSPEGFDLPKAYFATAQSIRDSLIINWNATYELYEKMNVKQAYYLSMEFLQGRALLNAIGNLELSGVYGEGLSKLGHKLENVVTQCYSWYSF